MPTAHSRCPDEGRRPWTAARREGLAELRSRATGERGKCGPREEAHLQLQEARGGAAPRSGGREGNKVTLHVRRDMTFMSSDTRNIAGM